jgi:hypothetical protein
VNDQAKTSDKGPWATFIETIRYKAGWSFEYLYMVDFDKEYIVIRTQVPDSRAEGTVALRPTVEVGGKYQLQPWTYYNTMEDRQVEILRTIHTLERHETCEWLRFGGELVFDPHKEIK